MVDINISELSSEDKEGIVQFIESKLPVKSDKSGDIVTFEDKTDRRRVTVPEIRTYLKRYIHKKDLKKDLRLLSEDGSLKFVKRPETGEKDEEEEEEKEE